MKTIFEKNTDKWQIFRIPALLRAENGDIIAYCEARRDGAADYGCIDLVQRRSTDGGRSWGEIETVESDGKNTFGNPCPVSLAEDGRICLVYCYNDADGGEKEILAGRAKRRVFVKFSDDFGKTYTAAREITDEALGEGYTWFATGPCHGARLLSGRIIIPCNHAVAGSLQIGQTRSHIMYSDDRGESWHIGAESIFGTNEATAAPLSDGGLYLNMRSNAFGARRAYAVSRDGGETLGETAAGLCDPYCQGSVYLASDGTLYFTNCDSDKRENLTLYKSRGGAAWEKVMTVNEGISAYSDICENADGELLILYEAGTEAEYERICLEIVKKKG